MGYIGAGISRFNTADELTVTGDAQIDTTTLVVDSTNNRVGIGTASPAKPLTVVGGDFSTVLLDTASASHATQILFQANGATNSGADIQMSDAGGMKIRTLAVEPLSFHTSASAGSPSERLRITSGGLVMVGTTTEGISDYGDTLTLADSDHCGMTIRSGTSSEGNVYFSDGTSGDAEYKGIVKYEHSSNDMSFWSNSLRRVTIDSSGNVGIGTASPDALLQIEKSDSGTTIDKEPSSQSGPNIAIHNSNQTANNLSSVQFTNRGTNGVAETATAGIHVKHEAQGGTYSYGSMNFNTTNSAGSYATRMHISSGGNVGIGTSSPGVLLDVKSSGQAAFGIGSTNAGGAILYLDGDSNGDYSGTDYSFIRHDTNGRLDIVQHSPSGTNQLRFYTGNTERARFDTSGQFRLNATQNQVTGYELFTCNGAAGFRNGDASVVGVWQTQTSAFAMQFFSGSAGNNVGSISVTANSTAFNTSSDRRLKSNIEDAASASDKIDAIQVRQFDWNVDDSHQDYGLIAQELQPIEPLAVTGDADSDKMMAVDYSKLVPMLIKEIQELRSRVAALEE